MNEEEILFNKLHDIFKKSISNKKNVIVLECAEPITVIEENREESEELT